MTSKDELHIKFYAKYKILIKDMKDIELSAFIEEMSDMALEARAGVSAGTDETRERRKANKKTDGPSGFQRNLNVDEASSDAINSINVRAEKLDKAGKMRAAWIKMGMSESEADSIMSARNIKDATSKPRLQDTTPVVKAPIVEIAKPAVNPFSKS
jgi:hypothetical protein